MNDMTKGFYISFLNYISSRELKKLYSNLCKQKLSVKGFLPNKIPPSTMLAPQIAKSEKVFFDVLEKFYSPNFDNCDDATNSFTPDTAVTCLTYFVKNGRTDESFLMSLLEKQETAQEEIQLSPENGRAKKKADEFREKYLSTRRELLQLKDDFAKLQAENISLKSNLCEKSSELDLAGEALRQFEEESSSTIDQLKKRIQELEENGSKHQLLSPIQSVSISILLIMDTDEFDGLGVDTLTYNNISQLVEVTDKYDKILLVVNDLPFAIKRKIHKIDSIQEKLVTFSTKQEMFEYVKQWRNG